MVPSRERRQRLQEGLWRVLECFNRRKTLSDTKNWHDLAHKDLYRLLSESRLRIPSIHRKDTLPKLEKTLDNNHKIHTLILHHIPYFHTIFPQALVTLPQTRAAHYSYHLGAHTAKIPHSNMIPVSVLRHPYASP